MLCFDNIPLLSAPDIKRWIIYKLYRQISKNEMIDQIVERLGRLGRRILIMHLINKK